MEHHLPQITQTDLPALTSRTTRYKIKLKTLTDDFSLGYKKPLCIIQRNVPTSNIFLFFKTSRCLYKKAHRCLAARHNKKTSDCISYQQLVIAYIRKLLNTPEMTGCCTVL